MRGIRLDYGANIPICENLLVEFLQSRIQKSPLNRHITLIEITIQRFQTCANSGPVAALDCVEIAGMLNFRRHTIRTHPTTVRRVPYRINNIKGHVSGLLANCQRKIRKVVAKLFRALNLRSECFQAVKMDKSGQPRTCDFGLMQLVIQKTEYPLAVLKS
jgi:hypothetical protein